ncbi:glucose-1-phosphate adenylyltransferase subunit GlgD [Paenibacillus sp. y28]|uniref:glucose-1-phosphate adenylyltransferase subunit GlgD n=1 Tax=Paenibacillus sp. y28 TaxID=3129110 RepID=UPI003019EE09
MNQLIGVVNLVNEPDDLEELTYSRCVASVPFGGRYRLIDFTLSNMVNSGIRDVAIFTHHKYRSLMDHLGSGKEWDLDRKRGGLFVLPAVHDEPNGLLKGDLFQFYCHRDYFLRAAGEYVLISRSHMVCNIDFRPVLESHLETGADVTVVYKTLDEEDLLHSKYRRIAIKPSGQVTLMEDYRGSLRSSQVSMEMYVMRKSLLLDMVETCLGQGHDHFVRDGIMKNIDKLVVYGYEFKGYVGIINSITGYYRNSMSLLQPHLWRELFFQDRLIYTKVKDEPPAKYFEGARVGGSLVANGCLIEGTVENSLVFRGVKIHKGAVVRNCILLQGCEIGQNAVVENTILDKEVRIQAGKRLSGDLGAPYIAAKNKVI